MRITQLRQADLNLLVVFAVFAEERNVSRASTRLLLSQPAVSRALQRLRDMFHDDLFVRTASGYELTPQGQRLLRELEVMLPRMDRLLSGSQFDPAMEEARFRIAATDNATSVLMPLLCRNVLPAAPKVLFDFIAWRDDSFDDLAHGRLDLVLNAEDGNIPSQMQSEVIYEEEFACVVSADTPYKKRMTIKQYLDASHISIAVFAGSQTIPERRLAVQGYKRKIVIRVPYFAAAMKGVVGTPLIATVPLRLAISEAKNPAVKVLAAPPELTGFRYLMIWHPRVTTDASHAWLRATIRKVGESLASKTPR
jgi:DNA-binding transcriptional LysR family regulator